MGIAAVALCCEATPRIEHREGDTNNELQPQQTGQGPRNPLLVVLLQILLAGRGLSGPLLARGGAAAAVMSQARVVACRSPSSCRSTRHHVCAASRERR
ncbi:hypothetical protein BDA96_01G210600 [Sorghum bicolor]|uniref:Uncharacterized protein n=2 Tax=Sorghum bicolor TaxID=4558 RepID=A0A921RYT9_SORBI|nr:hypothetical protein BDA96_01G210600 [Sorghum bicolor]OQU91525.1 hypothetical protein SORBI_3001G197901 [Sorghum bicolor]